MLRQGSRARYKGVLKLRADAFPTIIFVLSMIFSSVVVVSLSFFRSTYIFECATLLAHIVFVVIVY